MEKISIIIPCYNVEKYINRCLKSIEEQSYGMDNLEVILINDASTDSTYERLLEFEKKYPENVIIISCEKNSGPGTVRNIGLEYAAGKYISFVDADDVVDVDMIARMHEAMDKYSPDIVECGYKTFSDCDKLCKNDSKSLSQIQGGDYYLRIATDEERGRFILKSLKTAVWGRLYKKSFLKDNALHFPENIIYGEDNYFSGICMLLCTSYYFVDEMLYYYYQNNEGIIQRNNDNERIRQLADIMELYMYELDARGILDEGLSGYIREFEWYMIYKYFMDPVSFVVSRKIYEWRAQVDYFGRELLKYFPEAYNNPYLNSDMRWRDYIGLLKEISVDCT